MSWADLPAAAQDAVAILLALLPLVVLGAWLLRGHRPVPIVAALLRRHWGVTLTFMTLIAVCVAVSVALLSTERALRGASARATDPFDVVVAAPGSETTALLASIFLRPADMGLMDGATLARVLNDPRVALAAPISFGDSVGGAPVIGTVEALPDHLMAGVDGAIDGRPWRTPFEALVGADLPYGPGDRLAPSHGQGAAAMPGVHGTALTVVGRMAPTGTPWDGAVLIPLEGTWLLHALGDGHDPSRSAAVSDGGETSRLGPPYDPSRMPGVPAVLVRASGLGAAYSFRAEHQRAAETMAFLPGAELARLHGLLGDVREALTLSATLSLALVAAAVLCGLVIVARLFRRQIALLAALGAPRRFTIAVMWLHAVAHLVPGALVGLVLGWLASAPVAAIASSRTGLDIRPAPGMDEAFAAAVFVGVAALASFVTAPLAIAREPSRELR